jgi:hypothetical protein
MKTPRYEMAGVTDAAATSRALSAQLQAEADRAAAAEAAQPTPRPVQGA